MSIIATVLVFVGIPLGIITLIAIAVFGPALAHQPNRYRPGRAWNFEPSWFVPHPDAVVHDIVPGRQQLEGSAATTAVGGASGEW